MQPIDPQTGEDWLSETEALAFAERYLAPVEEVPVALE
jgi:hypothetical protein